MSGSHADDNKKQLDNVEMGHVDAASPAVPAASIAATAPPVAATSFSSFPVSYGNIRREEVPASAIPPEGGNNSEHTDTLRIRVWYLDDVFIRAAPKFVPDVATLKQLLLEKDSSFPMASSSTMAANHFAETLGTPPPAASVSTVAVGREGSAPLAGAASNTQLDTMHSVSDRQSFPSISLRLSSPTHPGGHPAWVSVKAASQDELTEILDLLPIHVLTRRRILTILCQHCTGDVQAHEPLKGEGSNTAATNLRVGEGRDNNGGGNSNEESGCEDEGCTNARQITAQNNFLEYFPAHGYAVLCLQAVPLPRGESTRRGTTPKAGMITHGTQTPCTPVVVLAFESTLFTFSPSRFGGEGDVRLIVANHIVSPTAHTAREAVPARVPTIAALSSIVSLSESDGNQHEATSPPRPDRAVDGADNAAVVFASTITTIPATVASPAAGRECENCTTYAATEATDNAMFSTMQSATPMTQEGYGGAHPSLPPLAYPSPPPFIYAGASALHSVEFPTTLISSPNWSAATAISVVCSSLISAIIAYLQQSTRALLMEADQLDELVLQILPSRVDQDDMLVRTKGIRNLIATFHIDALQKERVLKQLLLPAMRQTPLAQSTQAVERYQRSLSSIRSTVIKLRKGRDIVNMASMTLISGVSARLLTHCNFMDYLNHVQTQIAVVVMPIAVLPGIFATNVKVPWSDSQSMTPFYCLLTITLMLMIIGVSYPLYKFYMYRAPKALAPLE